MKTMLMGLAMVAIGCGSGGEGTVNRQPDAGIHPVVDPLVGAWELTTARGCVSAWTFQADAQFALGLLCSLANGGTALETSTGTYAVSSSGQINFAVARSTCADEPRTFTYGFGMSTPTQLELTASDGLLVYQKVAPMPASGVLTFGCWETDGLFHQMPLSQLP